MYILIDAFLRTFMFSDLNSIHIIQHNNSECMTARKWRLSVDRVQFQFFQSRMDTFSGWDENPVCRIPALVLAKAGFYFIGPDDRVKCYVCKKRLMNWDSDDNVWAEHRRLSPMCKLVNSAVIRIVSTYVICILSSFHLIRIYCSIF